MTDNQKQLFFRYHQRDDKEVARRIRAGETDFITGTGWALLDNFFVFLLEIGFYTVLEQVKGEGYRRIMVTLVRLLTTYSVKVLLGIARLKQVPELLFKDVGLLRRIGFTATQIKKGVCRRGKGKSKPMHSKILGDLLCRLTEKEVFAIFNGVIRNLSKKRYVRDETFILDTSHLETTSTYENCGMKKVTEKKWDRIKRTVVEITRYIYGFKIGMIQGAESRIPASCSFSQIQVHDNNFTKQLVKQAEANIGTRIKLLLIDRGFLDGKTLWWLHKRLTHFITRTRTDMNITQQMRSFRDDKEGNGVYRKKRKGLEIIGVEGLNTYDQYGDEEHAKKKNRKNFKANPINGVMVIKFRDKTYPAGKEPVFITDLPVDNPLKILDKYDLRSLIENQGFRELKQGWHINKFPAKKENAVRAHTILTLLIYAINAAYQTEQGQETVRKGIRRLRREDYQSLFKIVVYSGPYFGIFDIEEYSVITRSPPRDFVRTDIPQTIKRLGLKD
jgi:hypothetical protein